MVWFVTMTTQQQQRPGFIKIHSMYLCCLQNYCYQPIVEPGREVDAVKLSVLQHLHGFSSFLLGDMFVIHGLKVVGENGAVFHLMPISWCHYFDRIKQQANPNEWLSLPDDYVLDGDEKPHEWGDGEISFASLLQKVATTRPLV